MKTNPNQYDVPKDWEPIGHVVTSSPDFIGDKPGAFPILLGWLTPPDAEGNRSFVSPDKLPEPQLKHIGPPQVAIGQAFFGDRIYSQDEASEIDAENQALKGQLAALKWRPTEDAPYGVYLVRDRVDPEVFATFRRGEKGWFYGHYATDEPKGCRCIPISALEALEVVEG